MRRHHLYQRFIIQIRNFGYKYNTYTARKKTLEKNKILKKQYNEELNHYKIKNKNISHSVVKMDHSYIEKNTEKKQYIPSYTLEDWYSDLKKKKKHKKSLLLMKQAKKSLYDDKNPRKALLSYLQAANNYNYYPAMWIVAEMAALGIGFNQQRLLLCYHWCSKVINYTIPTTTGAKLVTALYCENGNHLIHSDNSENNLENNLEIINISKNQCLNILNDNNKFIFDFSKKNRSKKSIKKNNYYYKDILKNINYRSSRNATIKGFITAGLYKSLLYTSSKIKKRIYT